MSHTARFMGTILTSALCVSGACNAAPAGAAAAPPAAPREFRAAWVATVDNIDWPSKKGLSGDEQKREILAILDSATKLRLNCLIVQVRTTCDALYPSKLEPWSVYLSGVQGQAPKPEYDPLKMWVDEGHKRGIEIHAWFNPYRARFSDPKQVLAASHLANRRPDLVKSYGPYLWLDPGEPDAAKHSLAVFNDVTRRYDIDGIHIDDYFYPYPVKVSWKEDAKDENPSEAEKKARAARPELPFPDDDSWAKYKRSHPLKPDPTTAPADAEKRARDAWRRSNVDDLIHEIHDSTKRIKPWVKFGISPFGQGRPEFAPPGIKIAYNQYDKLYADAALWLQNGWCDYFTPQLYWPISQKAQSFPVLLDYWRSENKMNRHIWPGMYTSKLLEKPSTKPAKAPSESALNATQPATTAPAPFRWSAREIEDEIQATRDRGEGSGHVHFSMKALQRDAMGLSTALEGDLYASDALVPASPWLDDRPPSAPAVKLAAAKEGTRVVTLKPGRGEATWVYAIWKQTPGGWKFQVAPGTWKAVAVEGDVSEVVVTAVDRCGNESERVAAK